MIFEGAYGMFSIVAAMDAGRDELERGRVGVKVVFEGLAAFIVHDV